jgi:two-component system chemotaxis sensor kinase CheA
MPSIPSAAASVGEIVSSAAERVTSLRVPVPLVDRLMTLAGELVLARNQALRSLDGGTEAMRPVLQKLDAVTTELQGAVTQTRMQPVGNLFAKFPRLVRDLARQLNKKIELEISGTEVELDKSVLEELSDPLTHLVRNACDHGLETPAERQSAGKPPTGKISLSASQIGGQICIEVRDDGHGLDPRRIKNKALQAGLGTEEELARSTEKDLLRLILLPGFSTAREVTDVSGRGVGMDVVKKNISAMGGRIELDSMPGVGTRITVRLPLTLAILDGMSVGVGPETYIIPLGYVMESMQPERGMMKSVSGVERLIQVRGEYLPVICLHDVFRIQGAITDWSKGIMVVLEADGQSAALFIDQLVGQHQVVIKSLEANYRRVPGVAGATIMGDGRVALILDVPMLVGMARRVLPAAA